MKAALFVFALLILEALFFLAILSPWPQRKRRQRRAAPRQTLSEIRPEYEGKVE